MAEPAKAPHIGRASLYIQLKKAQSAFKASVKPKNACKETSCILSFSNMEKTNKYGKSVQVKTKPLLAGISKRFFNQAPAKAQTTAGTIPNVQSSKHCVVSIKYSRVRAAGACIKKMIKSTAATMAGTIFLQRKA